MPETFDTGRSAPCVRSWRTTTVKSCKAARTCAPRPAAPRARCRPL